MITLDEITQLSEQLIRQRSTFALLRMRHVLRAEGTTREHRVRLAVINDELHEREAL